MRKPCTRRLHVVEREAAKAAVKAAMLIRKNRSDLLDREYYDGYLAGLRSMCYYLKACRSAHRLNVFAKRFVPK